MAMRRWSQKEKKILKNHFTNLNDNVFGLVNLPEVIKGTLFSRYSRSGKNLRRLFLDEFWRHRELRHLWRQNTWKHLDVGRAEDFYERVLVGYGDNSVAELGGAHIALENISILATKPLEEHRLGLSFLEKSTRYVYFDRRDKNGDYLFYRPAEIMNSSFRDDYLRAVNLLFDTYSHLVRELQPKLKRLIPGDEKDPAYRFSIRAKACDLARPLLPLAALANMGIYANGRAFEYLITTLLAHPLDEVRKTALAMNRELRKIIPAFIKRATSEKGEVYRKYLQNRRWQLKPWQKQWQGKEIHKKPLVRMVDYDRSAESKILQLIAYSRSNLSYSELKRRLAKLTSRQKKQILRDYLAGRQNRFHKPGRALEEVYFSFEIVADWGVYKDLMRHRVLTRHHQTFTSGLGYRMPPYVEVAGFAKPYRRAMEVAAAAQQAIAKKMPVASQYLVNHGSINRFYIRLNLREAVHLVELRSQRQGHPWYREVAQEIGRQIKGKLPILGKIVFPFMDENDYELERLGAFRKLIAKAEKLGVVPLS